MDLHVYSSEGKKANYCLLYIPGNTNAIVQVYSTYVTFMLFDSTSYLLSFHAHNNLVNEIGQV